MPAREMVVVGCRLPQGLILHHPVDRSIQVKLEGPRLVVADGKKLSSSFATTEVDAEFWGLWKAAYAKNPVLLSHAIFEAKSQGEAAAKAKELQKEKTGFEQMPQTAAGISKANDVD